MAPKQTTAKLNGPYSGTVGQSITVDPTGSTSAPGSTLKNGTIGWGDGDTAEWGGKPAVESHVYQKAGSFTVVLTVWDTKGRRSTVDAMATIADVVAPTPTPTPDPVPVPDPTPVPVPDKPAAAPTVECKVAGWCVFLQAFPKGFSSTSVKLGTVATQVDVRTRWPDGSIRQAQITVQLTPGLYTFAAALAVTGHVTVANPTGISAIVVLDGQATTITLPTGLLTNWADGALRREGFVRVLIALHVYAIWDIQMLSDGHWRVRLTLDNSENDLGATGRVCGWTILNNGTPVLQQSASVSPGPNPLSVTGDGSMVSTAHGLAVNDWVRLTGGPQVGQSRCVKTVIDVNTVSLNSNFDAGQSNVAWEKVKGFLPWGANWTAVFASSGYVEGVVDPDVATFVAVGAFPSYLSTVINPTRSIAGPQFAIGSIGDLTYPLGATGDRQEIGLYPAWVAQYLVHKNPDQRAYVVRMGELAGSFSVHCTETDGRRTNLDIHPGFTWPGPADGENGPAGGGPNTYGRGYYGEDGAAHQPSLAYIPYLLTGERFYLNELKSWADYAVMSWLWLRNGGAGLMTAQQLRGLAWGLRDIVDAAVCCPDSDPDKAYFTTRVQNNLNDLMARLPNEHDPLGGSTVIDQQDQKVPTQLFMQAFFVWSIDHAIKQGFADTGFRTRICKYYNSLCEAWELKYVTAYLLNIARTDGTYLPSLTALRDYNFAIPGGLYPFEPIPAVAGYGGNLRVILTIADALGLPKASTHLAALMAHTDVNGNMVDDVNTRSQYAVQ